MSPLTYTVNDTVRSKSLPVEHSFLGVSGGEVALTALKRAEDGEDVVCECSRWRAGRTGREALRDPDSASIQEGGT